MEKSVESVESEKSVGSEKPVGSVAPGGPLGFEFADPIVTERLTLRLMTIDDLDDMVSYNEREDVVRYELHGTRGVEELAEKIPVWGAARRMTHDGDYLQLAVQLESRVIGDLYLTVVSAANRQGEIGWTLHPDFQHRGYATEAASAGLDLLFGPVGLHRVRAELDPRNAPSVALCERLGMRREATFRHDLWFKGEWGDSGIYAILADDWAARG